MATPYDMANMTVTGTPGTGTITLNAAVTGYQTFASAGVPNGKTVSYGITDGVNWEVGRGVYTSSGTSLSRGPIFSSNGNAAINMTSAATVRIALLADDFADAGLLPLAAAGVMVSNGNSLVPATLVGGSLAGTTLTFTGISSAFLLSTAGSGMGGLR